MNALQKGTLLCDRYEIDDTIGQGSFGITYKAFDKKLGRVVAIKECFPSDCCKRGDDGKIIPNDITLYDKSLLEMVNEARTLAEFKHPRVVTIHDVMAYNGAVYCIMEWVEGETLHTLMNKADGRVDELTAYRWLTEMLRTLDCIHGKNIVHRDIKPSNIIIRKSQVRDTEELVLVDFGSALNRNLKAGMTVPGPYTPAYAAPEQVDGRKKIGAWTDLYSLAVTFYDLLGGHDGKELLLQSKVMSKSIMKNMCYEPDDRCSTAREWLEELNHSSDAVVVDILNKIIEWKQIASEKAGKKGLKTADVDEICKKVRGYFVMHLGKIPDEINVKISAVETMVSPTRLARVALRQRFGAIVGGAAGAGLIGGGAAIAGGAGVGLWGAIVAFFLGGPVAVPIAMGAGGVALVGVAIKAWMGKSQAQRVEEVLEHLSKGLMETIPQCWLENSDLWKS